jgi:hypothetical protein
MQAFWTATAVQRLQQLNPSDWELQQLKDALPDFSQDTPIPLFSLEGKFYMKKMGRFVLIYRKTSGDTIEIMSVVQV